MAKPDMSRNKDLAGKTVSKGGYNISYNENGYATSAIKTGSKTGKAAAPSADTVSGGGSDRGSYGGSVYDQEHFSNDELRSAAEVRAAAAAGKTTWADAHDYVERIRSNYGYSGDSDGSRYIPLEMGGGGRGNGGGGFSYEAAPTYTSRYQNQIDDLTRQILNREAFSYDPEKDPTYQQYKESYTRNGERAMQDTLGQVSARTGGLASSYAGSAAQQTYDNYMGALADKIPELKQLAYSMYQDEGNTQRANLEMLEALEQGDYNKYLNALAQHNNDRNFAYGVYRDQWDRNYQLDRDGVNDSRYDMEWNYGVGRDELEDSRYQDETEYARALEKAQTLAAGGDFSGYKAMGYSDQEIANLKNAYDREQAAGLLSRGGGSGRSSGGSGSSKPRLTESQVLKAINEDRVTDAVIAAYDYYYGDGAYEATYGGNGAEATGNEEDAVVDMNSVLSLGYGPISEDTLAKLEADGQIASYVENGKIKFRRVKGAQEKDNPFGGLNGFGFYGGR